MDYQKGYEAGYSDFVNAMMPAVLRGYSIEYRNGYSDGYFKASKARHQW